MTATNLERHRVSKCPLPPAAAPSAQALAVAANGCSRLDPGNGDALRAAIATVLSLGLDEVPPNIANDDIEQPTSQLATWLGSIGLGFVLVPVQPGEDAGDATQTDRHRFARLVTRASEGVACVISGFSAIYPAVRHFVVAVVGADGSLEPAWNPDPSGGMLSNGSVTWALFIVRLAA